MSFYPDKKKYISPSAFSSFHNSKASFVKSYFEGIRSAETPRMKAGTMIHGLLEGGFMKSHMRFEIQEETLEIPFRNRGVNVLGKPDSYGMYDGVAKFLDYKSSSDSSWTRESLNNDLKMELTAWLVWKELGEPEKVEGYIYWIGTEWNGEQIIPSKGEFGTVKCVYTAHRLFAFEEVIDKTISDVNKLYELHEQGIGLELNEELVQEYANITEKIKKVEEEHIKPLEDQKKHILTMLEDQMQFVGKESYSTYFGTFYWKTAKKFQYPKEIEYMLPDGTVRDGEFAEQVILAYSAVKKHFELYNEPMVETKSLQFRSKRKKYD